MMVTNEFQTARHSRRARAVTLGAALTAALCFAATNCHNDSNTIVGPAATATPMAAGTPTLPAGPTPTPAPPIQAAIVNVGQGGNFFVDNLSGTSTTTIRVGEAVRWTWVANTHSTTSGTCSGGGCLPDGIWDSGIGANMTFTHLFTQPGTFPYFCQVHGAMMQGTVIVQ